MSGPGWMDHRWADVTRRDIGWDWSSIQLDDGSDLMVAVIWDPEGRRHLAGHGTYREPDGDVTHYDDEGISITSQEAWVSPETGIEYPSGWRVEVAPLGLELELTPFADADAASEARPRAAHTAASSIQEVTMKARIIIATALLLHAARAPASSDVDEVRRLRWNSPS